MGHSLLRLAEHAALSTVTMQGRVIDLGGDRRAPYADLIGGSFDLTVLNFDAKARPDIVHDLEQPLPIESSSYDGVLLINVLEHIYHERQLLAEASRILAPGGKVVVVVPFLFPVHPSPRDFRRFTAETLERMMVDAGLSQVKVTPLGRGVWSSRHLMLNRLLPTPLRQVHAAIGGTISRLFDWLFVLAARTTHRQYDPHHYALGYMAVASKT